MSTSVKLSDICETTQGIQISKSYQNTRLLENNIRYLYIEDLIHENNMKYIENAYPAKTVTENDLVMANTGSPGRVFKGKNGVLSNNLFRIRFDNNRIAKDFLYYILSSKSFQYILQQQMKGGIQKHLGHKTIGRQTIPLPPLPTQKRIVAALDKAQELIDKRMEQIRLLDELIQSTFYDMFGDPVSNPMGWEVRKLGEIGGLKRGKSKHRPRNAPELLGGKYPLVQTGDIANAGYYLNEYKQTYSEIGLKQSKMWEKGTLCITIAANIAKTAILGFDACFPDSVVAFIPSKFTEVMYIQIWFGFLQKIIEASAPESAQKNINLKILNELDIPIPPIELQNQFAEIVEKIEQQEEQMQQSLKEMEDNFNSIMQRAFKGEMFQ